MERRYVYTADAFHTNIVSLLGFVKINLVWITPQVFMKDSKRIDSFECMNEVYYLQWTWGTLGIIIYRVDC